MRSLPSWSRLCRKVSCPTKTRWGSATPCDATTPCGKAQGVCAGTTPDSPKSSFLPRAMVSRTWMPSPDARPTHSWPHSAPWWAGGLVSLLHWWVSSLSCFLPYPNFISQQFWCSCYKHGVLFVLLCKEKNNSVSIFLFITIEKSSAETVLWFHNSKDIIEHVVQSRCCNVFPPNFVFVLFQNKSTYMVQLHQCFYIGIGWENIFRIKIIFLVTIF